MPRMTLRERFEAKVDRSGGPDACHLWTAFTHPVEGYGRINVSGKIEQAHRIAWGLANGRIPEGLLVCHHCDNRACVNLRHLFLGTDADNIHDAKIKGRIRHGVKHPNAKLNPVKVWRIHALLREGLSAYAIAQRFNVDHKVVDQILKGRTWTHVKPNPAMV